MTVKIDKKNRKCVVDTIYGVWYDCPNVNVEVLQKADTITGTKEGHGPIQLRRMKRGNPEVTIRTPKNPSRACRPGVRAGMATIQPENSLRRNVPYLVQLVSAPRYV